MSESPPVPFDVLESLLDLVTEDPPQRAARLPVLLTRVRHEGRPWLYHTVRVPDEATVHAGDRVIFEVPGDSAFGEVVDEPALRVPPEEPSAMPVIKAFSAQEVAQIAEKVSRREAEAFAWFRDRVAALRLPMKPVHIEMSALQGRVVFYFWAETRVDFRTLLQDLKRRVQGTIELTQVGAHEAARQIGGIGRCHRELCARVLPTYPPVSPKHARVQGLSPNPQKHLGACGRLMGCLQYEQDQYQEARKGLPKEGKTVETPLGLGVIKELDILRARVRVRTEDGQWGTFHVSELKRDGKPLVAAAPKPETETGDVEADAAQDFELAERPAPRPAPAPRPQPAPAPPRQHAQGQVAPGSRNPFPKAKPASAPAPAPRPEPPADDDEADGEDLGAEDEAEGADAGGPEGERGSEARPRRKRRRRRGPPKAGPPANG